eukprot:SAG11_NODE_1624_length_4555_cov_3.452424_2_plen_146_part_00
MLARALSTPRTNKLPKSTLSGEPFVWWQANASAELRCVTITTLCKKHADQAHMINFSQRDTFLMIRVQQQLAWSFRLGAEAMREVHEWRKAHKQPNVTKPSQSKQESAQLQEGLAACSTITNSQARAACGAACGRQEPSPSQHRF